MSDARSHAATGLADETTGAERPVVDAADAPPTEEINDLSAEFFVPDAWVGRELDGRYRVEGVLGEGGMGVVLLAEHLKLRKKVAVKLVLPRHAAREDVAGRFAREAHMGGMLEHPHVVSATDYGTLPGGEAFLVLQFVKGHALREEMGNHAGDWLLAARIGAQIADALAAVHASEIVHRDLKPENVIVEKPSEDPATWHARLLDFGVATFMGEQAELNRKLTRAGMVVGTPGYVAPEQAVGETVDARADLYALGVVLWELVAGALLFTGDSVTEILTKQLTERAPRLSTLVPNVPTLLDELVAALLEQKRDARPSKATEVRDILRRVVAEAPELTIAARAETEQAATMYGVSVGRGSPVAARETAVSRRPDTPRIGWWIAVAVITVGYAVTTAWSVADWVRDSYARPPDGIAAETPPASGGGGAGTTSGTLGTTSAEGPTAVPAGFDVPGTPTTTPSALPHPSTGAAHSGTDDLRTMLEDRDRNARAEAANRVLAGPASTPAFDRAVANYEVATRCESRRAALRELRELGDARGLVIVDRAAALPTRGCGFLGVGDCHRCLRSEVRRARRALSPTSVE